MSVVGLHEGILPRGTRLDVARSGPAALTPPVEGLGDELRAVVAPDVGGRAPFLRDLLQDLDGVIRGETPGNLARERLPG